MMATIDQVRKARAFRKSLTPSEARLWRELKTWRGDGFHWRRQAPFRGWYLDFVCFTTRIVVELDGRHHEDDPEQRRADEIRDAVLRRERFAVLRFTNGEITAEFERVLSDIREVAKLRRPAS